MSRGFILPIWRCHCSNHVVLPHDDVIFKPCHPPDVMLKPYHPPDVMFKPCHSPDVMFKPCHPPDVMFKPCHPPTWHPPDVMFKPCHPPTWRCHVQTMSPSHMTMSCLNYEDFMFRRCHPRIPSLSDTVISSPADGHRNLFPRMNYPSKTGYWQHERVGSHSASTRSSKHCIG